MRTPICLVTSLWALFMLGWRTRFRMNGAYWRWRRETAFGGDPAQWPSQKDRRTAMLEYGRWVHTMRRLR